MMASPSHHQPPQPQDISALIIKLENETAKLNERTKGVEDMTARITRLTTSLDQPDITRLGFATLSDLIEKFDKTWADFGRFPSKPDPDNDVARLTDWAHVLHVALKSDSATIRTDYDYKPQPSIQELRLAQNAMRDALECGEQYLDAVHALHLACKLAEGVLPRLRGAIDAVARPRVGLTRESDRLHPEPGRLGTAVALI
jgi:hypothetical protein